MIRRFVNKLTNIPRVSLARAKDGDRFAITPSREIKFRLTKCLAIMSIISSSKSCPGSEIRTMGTGVRHIEVDDVEACALME